jgi:adenylosuccinate lyase
VQRNAMTSFHEQRDFKQLLLDDTDVARVLGRDVIEEAFDLKAQLKHASTIFDRVFAPAAVGSR